MNPFGNSLLEVVRNWKLDAQLISIPSGQAARKQSVVAFCTFDPVAEVKSS